MRGESPAPEDADGYSLAEFLAHIALEGKLQSSTIATYRSAVSSWVTRGTLSDEPPIGASVPVRLVLQGIDNTLRPGESAAAYIKRKEEPGITPEMLAAILQVAPGGSPRNAMYMAAAHLGVYAQLRPNEMLGVRGAREKESIKLSQVTFYMSQQHPVIAEMHKTYLSAAVSPLPSHFTLALGSTKADRFGTNPPKVVAAPSAVAALWYWLHIRRELRPPAASSEYVFIHPGSWSFLNIQQLMKQLSTWGKLAGVTSFDFIGRSLRRGGTEALYGGGAAVADVQAAGGWRSATMPALYAGPAGGLQRRLLISKSMEPSSSQGGK